MRKKRLFIKILFSLSAAGYVTGHIYASEPDIKIFILKIAGVRNNDCIAEDGVDNYPALNETLFPEGYLFKKLLSVNSQFHMPQTRAICFGLTQKCEIQDALEQPSWLQYARSKYNLPAEKVVSIGHWYTTAVASNSDENYPEIGGIAFDYINENMPYNKKLEVLKADYDQINKKYDGINQPAISLWPNWDIRVRLQHDIAMQVLKDYKPDFIYYEMSSPEIAHFGTFAQYIVALRENDVQIKDIWDMIQKDPYYKDRTYLFICIDAGRNEYYMQHNESFFNMPEYTWLYVYGPGVQKGIINDADVVYHTDLFATIAYLLDLKVHENDGKNISELFIEK